MELFLNRFCQIPAKSGMHPGTFGSLTVEDYHLAFTVERPWNGNKRFISCIPDGLYKLLPYDSPKYGECFLIVNPGLNVYAFESDCLSRFDRYACLFAHKGSFPKNFMGCVGAGDSLRVHDRYGMMATNTTETCETIMELLKGEEHTLNIYTPPGCL